MDEVDLAILQEMTSPNTMLFSGLDPRRSPESMAKRVHLDPSTIRARIKGWKENGFLRTWRVLPSPATLGLHHFVSYLHAPNVLSRQDILATIEAMDGVVCTFEQVHGLLGIGTYAESEAQVKRRLRTLSASPDIQERPPFGKIECTPLAKPLKPKDWQLIAALQQDPEVSMRDLSALLNLSPNTTSRRYHTLVESGAIWSVPDLDFTRFTGGVLVRLIMSLDSQARRDVLSKAIEERFGAPAFQRENVPGNGIGERTLHLMVCLGSVAETDDLEATALRIPGVLAAETMMPRAFRVHTEWLAECVQAQLTRT